MGLGDFIPDPVKHVVKKVEEKVGEGVDDAGHAAAYGLGDIGWDSGAHWLRDKSDAVANRLGANVDELQLGETDDPKKLIHGSVGKLRSVAGHLKDFEAAFERVGKGLQGLHTGDFKGLTADAFRERIAPEPKKWFTAADACEKAAGALSDFAGTVEWAQGQAREAIRRYQQGKQATKDARAAHKKQVSAYDKAVDVYNDTPGELRDPAGAPVRPGDFQDPGAADIEAAKGILDDARRQRDDAEAAAVKAVHSAREAAPPKPSYAHRVHEGLDGLQLDSAHFSAGILKGTADMLDFANSLNPLDYYNITHPNQYLTTLDSTVAGLIQTANDPFGTAKTMLDGFAKDPAEGAGRLIPQFVGTDGLGGLKDAASAARDLADAERLPSRSLLDHDGPGAHDTPDGLRPSEGTDPVDLASGKMYLPQTDIVLPGVLPLVFGRRAESGYRLGRWFGPSWSSTIDQHLEIDAQGVVFVCEDGLLLSYPHPAPGLPTLPVIGPQRPLERDRAGDYTVTDPDTGRTWYFTGPPGGGDGEAVLDQIGDRNGNWITFARAPDGTPTGIDHCAGYQLRITAAEGRITALHLGGTQVLTYGYTDGNLTHVTGSSGLPLRFAYDERARIISWTDTNDRTYHYTYDDRDRCVAEGGEAGHIALTIAYGERDPRTAHRTTTVTTAQGHTTRYQVNDAGKVTAVTDPLGHTVRTAYDARGRVLSHTDALGGTTSYRYDAAGKVTGVVRPDGCEATTDYDEAGRPVAVTDVDGGVWRQEYDERGNRIGVTDPAGAVTRYRYDERGGLTSVTDALGATTRIRCDTAGLPVEVTDPLDAVTRYERDAFGRVVAVTDALGAAERLEWTVEGQLARRVAADGAVESWVYDGEGNCVRHTDAAGGVTAYEYTHFDLPAARTDPDGTRYEFTHDAALRLTQVTNPQGLTWTYTYDPAGRLATETDFDERTLTYTYDAAGQLLSRTDPLGQRTTFQRDALGQVVRRDAAGRITTYNYDPAGRLIAAANPDAGVVYQRDRLGRVKSEMVAGRVLTFAYDAEGRPVRRTTPSGAVTTYAYDPAGNRTTLTTGGHTLAFTHDAAGRETTRRISDTLTLSQTWDPTGRLHEQLLTAAPAGVVQRRAYTYRGDGHLTGIDDHLTGPRRFDLDVGGRVTAVHAARWSETYSYDEAGNQTTATWPAGHPDAEATGPRTYTGTRITRAGTIRYEHDAAGRVTLRQKTRLSRKPDTWHYTWDAEDHLTTVTTPDGTIWRYLYDPLGRRTAKVRLADDGATVLEQVDFTWDGPTLIEQTTTAPDAPHPVTLTWDHDGLHPLTQTERITDTTTQRDIDHRFFAIVTDLIGTPSELVDDTGTVTWRARATVWGTTTWPTTATAYTPLRFPGQYYDPETGLHYNLNRHYDPTTARYTTPDPLGLTPAPNPLTYVHNPHTWTDPLGLSPYLGLRNEAQRAIEKFENIKRDPIGEINSQPNHNHYNAARREANGEVVARKPDGTPFDHIQDLTQARNGLDGIRRTLEREIASPPDTITERGVEVLLAKRKEVIHELDRLNGFLHSIGRR